MPYMHHLEPGIIGLLGLPDHPCAQAAMRPSMPHKFCSEFPTPKKEGQKPTPYLVPGQNLDPEKDWLNVEFMAKKDESKNVMNFEQQLEELSMQAVYDLNGTPSLLDSSTKLSSEIDHINTPSDSIKEIGKQTAQVERPYFSIIADGIHVHPQIVSMAYNAHPEGCILISDAMHMLDPSLPDSTYPWRDGSIEKRDGGITLAGTNTLAGSILPLCDAITNLSKFADIPLSKAIVCATYTPAKALGGEIERKVGLSIGCWADLCIWDEKGLKGVWKGGKEVWHVA
ncbi:uncharacterized protein I206_100151 [Kwoniella pini CBS 10737]|uniref:N-acetylglucosamine-6-phosphate deacetylase n=1 Tax=Kwoniella pini CBS 10737 TaxID=1296096 RepID=A0AAJ8KZ77_9TREE